MNASDGQGTAVQEWKYLQSVIDRHERIVFQMRGWLYALITGLFIAGFGAKLAFPRPILYVVAFTFVGLFLSIEALQRVPLRRAVTRVKAIEAFLRDDTQYDGPRLSLSLSEGSDIRDAIKELRAPRVWFPYGILCFGVFLIFVLAP